MEKFKLDEFKLDKSITENLPLYCNFIQCNKLVPIEVENKMYYFSSKYQGIMSGFPSEKPISKIVDFTKI
ncbi:hypothetical protein [Yeosuana sp.]|uniref:hypothetical protein n=1 Tax=Yeosuana sp. TaxID=2529388 RepID=UPI004054D26E